MRRRSVLILAGLACAAILMAATAAAALANDIPGVPISASPVQGYLDNSNYSGVHIDDVYNISLRVGDRLHAVLNAASSTEGWFFVQLFAPGSMGIGSTTPLTTTSFGQYPQALDYTATTAGQYYVDVEVKWAAEDNQFQDMGNDVAGAYGLAWSCKSPTMTVLATHSHTVRSGSRVAVTGALEHAVGGSGIGKATVYLQRSANGKKWSKVSTTTTSASGSFAFKVKATKTCYYHAVFAGTSSLIASKSIAIRIKTGR